MDKELLNKLNQLENRIKQLEATKQDNVKAFGRSYNQVGSSNSDFIIKTKGQVKIQWGQKFIDLLKDGKINVNSDFIFKAKQVGSKNGIYVLEDGTVWLQMSGVDPIPIVNNEVGSTYVSFLGEQESTSEQKRQALVNIGFIYPTLGSVDSSSLQNGVIYIESEQKLYMVHNGTLSEFKISIPNPFTEQFVIAKSDDKKGALYIQGKGSGNSLAFDQAWFYCNEQHLVQESEIPLLITIAGKEVLEISDSKVVSNVTMEGDTFQSKGASSTNGFRLYILGEKSVLEVDKIIVRDQDESDIVPLYPEYWLWSNNIISEYSVQTDEDSGTPSENLEYTQIEFELTQASKFKVGDILVVYKKDSPDISDEEGEENPEVIQYMPLKLTVTELTGDTSIQVESSEGLTKDDLDTFIGKFIFLVQREGGNPLRIQENTIDSVEYTDDSETVKARIGSVKDLQLEVTSGNTTSKDSELVEDADMYGENAIFGLAKYLSNTTIPENDDSSTLASTEWVRRIVQSSIPSGAIIAYNGGQTPPTGWAICDGNNGTPNLLNKFIISGTTQQDHSIDVGVPTEEDKVTLPGYSLVFIMKL